MTYVANRTNGIYTIEGKQYPSVTNIIGTVLAKPALNRWFVYQGAEVQRTNPKIIDNKEIYNLFREKQDKTKDRGSKIHSIIESYYKTGNLIEPMFNEPYLLAFKNFIKDYKVEPKHIEVTIHSDKYGYAGTCDMIGVTDNKACIIDWKTNKDARLYSEVELQMSAYAHAAVEMGLIDKLDARCACSFGLNGKYTFKWFEDSFSTFQNILEVYKWIKK